MLLIFVAWLALFVIALVKFRKGANPEPRAQGVRGTCGRALAIGAVIVGDVIILATQALPAWSARNAPPPAGAQPIEIHITAEQFAWNIHYPGPDGVFGRTSQALISASNPVGIDRDGSRGGGRHRLAERADAAGQSHRGHPADEPRRDSQLHVERDAREAGCGARHDRRASGSRRSRPAIGRSPARSCAVSATTACAANITWSNRPRGRNGRPKKWRD